jgi:hypothetical protein
MAGKGSGMTIEAARVLSGDDRRRAADAVRENHYAHSVPSGKTHYFAFGPAIVLLSIPANLHCGRKVLGRPGVVWELTRLWAPDGHERNLLTAAIASAVAEFRKIERKVEALVSYADPNVGHAGYVYRAASWVFQGVSEESRYYIRDGQCVARRKFHSGKRCMTKAEILAMGYEELRRPGKLRFARGLTRRARADVQANVES